MDDVQDFMPPSRLHSGHSDRPKEGRGFVVKGGPWEQTVPDTSDAQEFPSFCNEMSATEASSPDDGPRNSPWGGKASRP